MLQFQNNPTILQKWECEVVSNYSVVLIEYPRKGVWAVGFATKENTGEMAEKTNKKLVNVFVPTTPNPTSNGLSFIDMKNGWGAEVIISLKRWK